MWSTYCSLTPVLVRKLCHTFLNSDQTPASTFNTPFGRYAYNRLPYGLCSAPEVFHKYMKVMFGNIEESCVYMDDILVWGSTEEEHNRQIQEVKDRKEQLAHE